MVNLNSAVIQTWQKVGLTHLYFEPEALAKYQAQNKVQNQAYSQAQPKVVQTQVATKTPQTQTNQNRQLQARSEQAHSVQAKTNQDKASQASPAEIPNSQVFTIQTKILDFELWDQKWLDLHKRTTSKPIVLWTYKEFGQDLLGSPNPARKKLIAYFLGQMKHAKGTHAFWPVDIPENPNSEYSLFWSGVAKLNARCLIIFGQECLTELGLPQLEIYSNQTVNGKMVITLPNINKLAEQSANVNSVLAFLQRSLSFLA